MIGAEAAALTHGHELGYIPAAMFVHMIHLDIPCRRLIAAGIPRLHTGKDTFLRNQCGHHISQADRGKNKSSHWA